MDLTPTPTGTDTQVNTDTSGRQLYSAVAVLDDGSYVVIWHKDVSSVGWGVYGQRYAADGTLIGTEFHVNAGDYDTGTSPTITALTGGGFVVTWSSWGMMGDPGLGVYGRVFDANGAPLAEEFHINSYTDGQQVFSAVAAMADGGFLVTWSSYGWEVGLPGPDGSGSGIVAQRYAADGTPVGNEFLINSTTLGEQFCPSVTTLADGSFVVTWQSDSQDGSDNGIYGQRYSAAGTPVGSEFQINTYTTGAQQASYVRALKDGGFVVTWASSGQDGSGTGIYGQRYAADGTALGSEFQVNSYTLGDQDFPAVTALEDGGFVVTWSSNGQDGSGWGIYGQRFTADGTAAGSEFKVNEVTTGDQFFNGSAGGDAVMTLADGRLVQVWTGPGSEDVFYRFIDVPVDTDGPTLVGIVQTDPAQTTSGQVHYTVSFSEPVTGVDVNAFTLVTSGVVGASITGVNAVPGSYGKQYTVTVDAGMGDGTLSLLLTGTGVTDFAGNSLERYFQAQSANSTASAPFSVRASDLNGDGNIDLAVANYSSNSISVLLGNGDGSFQPHIDYPTGQSPAALEIGDVNGDGIQDLVAADRNSSSVSILIGYGDGTFQGGGSYASYTPYDIAIGDLNSDGIQDIAVANQYSDSLSILIGNGDGTFQPGVTYGAQHQPISVDIGDVNGDGYQDLVAANVYSDSLSLYLGNGDGTFQPQLIYHTQSGPFSASFSDVNADGDLDIVVAYQGVSSISVILGNGDGTFQPLSTYATQAVPTSIAIADFNADGNLDLVVGNRGSDSASVLIGNGDGTFQSQILYPTLNSPYSVTAADFNGDGAPDIAIANAGSNSVSVLVNLTPTFTSPTYTIEETAGVLVYDGTTLVGTYDTIQAAIDSATTLGGADWKIKVIQAHYTAGPESILVTKDVTIETDTNAGNNPNDESPGNERALEVFLNFADIRAGGVTIDGFSFVGSTAGVNILDASNVSVINNIFSGSTDSYIAADYTTPQPGNAAGTGINIANNLLNYASGNVSIQITDYQSTNVSGNVLTGSNDEFGIALTGNVDNSTVSGNTVSGYKAGVLLSQGVSPDTGTSGTTISDNLLTNNATAIWLNTGNGINTVNQSIDSLLSIEGGAEVVDQTHVNSVNLTGAYVASSDLNASLNDPTWYWVDPDEQNGTGYFNGLQEALTASDTGATITLSGHAHGSASTTLDGLIITSESSAASATVELTNSDAQNITIAGKASVTVTGNEFANAIDGERSLGSLLVYGGGGDDVIWGAGNVDGGDGTDQIIGTDNDDSLNGGADWDWLAGSSGNDTYTVDDPGDVIVENAGAGIDTVLSSVSITSLWANVDNAVLTGSGDIDIAGNGLANVLTGNAGENELFGGAGDDQLYGALGNDLLLGGAGNDRLDGGSGADQIVGGSGTDTAVYSGAWADYTVAGNGPFLITDNRIGTTDGSDVVLGVEYFTFSNGTFAATEIGNDAPADIQISNAAISENLANGQTVGTLSSTDADAALGDTAVFTLVDDADGRFGLSGNDLVVTNAAGLDYEAATSHQVTLRVTDAHGDSYDEVITINLTDLNDIAPVITTAATQTVAENATVVAALTSTDADTVGTIPATFSITGGVDAALFDILGDNLVFKAGRDYETQSHTYAVQVTANDGSNTSAKTINVSLTDENDNAPVITTPATLSVSENATFIAALTASDADTVGTSPATFTITGGANAALFDISAGALIFKTVHDYETQAHSYVVEVTANDGVNTTAQMLTVNLTNVSPEIITGTSSNNILTGGSDIDKIYGLNGNDTLSGLGANDVLIGGNGRDIMWGGAGLDDFDFNAVSETGKTASTRDVIKDFVHLQDDIDLSTIDANGSAAGNAAFTFLAAKGAAFTGTKGQLRWLQTNAAGSANDKTIIEGDLNGDKVADFQIELTGLINLSSGDFIL